jgi:hypothetical protein
LFLVFLNQISGIRSTGGLLIKLPQFIFPLIFQTILYHDLTLIPYLSVSLIFFIFLISPLFLVENITHVCIIFPHVLEISGFVFVAVRVEGHLVLVQLGMQQKVF